MYLHYDYHRYPLDRDHACFVEFLTWPRLSLIGDGVGGRHVRRWWQRLRSTARESPTTPPLRQSLNVLFETDGHVTALALDFVNCVCVRYCVGWIGLDWQVAHAGIALSDAEASVVSSFTSRSKSCASVVDLLKEGRAALHTNFAAYKFIITYGQLFRCGTLPTLFPLLSHPTTTWGKCKVFPALSICSSI
jgi:hypothetical protein